MSESKLCCKRNLKGNEKAACVCGCDEKSGNFFVPGHDQRLLGYIKRNDPDECSDVLWCSVPRCFHRGKFADEITAHRATKDCADTSEIVPKNRSKGCPYDKNPT